MKVKQTNKQKETSRNKQINKQTNIPAFVLSKESMQFVLKTPSCNCSKFSFSFLAKNDEAWNCGSILKQKQINKHT